MASDAVGTERISRVIGYKIKKGDFATSSPNLPQRIVVLGEANEANQSSLDVSAKEITSAQQAGQLYGFGSPIHIMMRILRPLSGDGVGGIPTIVIPQAKAVGSAAKVMDITPSLTTITANGTHTLKVAGRGGMDYGFYDINIVTTDTVATLSSKISDALNALLGSPVIGTSSSTKATATAKWAGLTSNDLSITIDTNGDSLGITYVVALVTAGSGTPTIAAALALFGSNWNTIVVNPYTAPSIMAALEAFNGIPDPEVPTGRYVGIIMKPFIAITGSTLENPTTVTDGRLNDVTIAIAPAPLSAGLPMEAAANMAVLFAKVTQDTPHLDVSGKSYPDMPTPLVIGAMSDYNNRDSFVKKGCSTVDLVAGKFVVQDFVTTYHPVGETPPQFRYCRNLMLDFNVRYGYYLLEQINVVDHSIANDDDIVSASKVIKPKQWVQIVSKYAEDLVKRALIVDAQFLTDSLQVGISTINPDRLETTFRYKRSGFVRIASTTAEAGFNFGTLN